MKCIVCAAQLPEENVQCSICGFLVSSTKFLNKEQYQRWFESEVVPARNLWDKKEQERIQREKAELEIRKKKELETLEKAKREMQRKKQMQLIERIRCNASQFAAASIDFYALLGTDGKVSVHGLVGSHIRKAGNWTNIISIAAGNGHLLALKNDGTVLAAGKNGVGQCQVEAWTDIVQIAAAGDTTVGLKNNGELLACGADADIIENISQETARDFTIESISMNRAQIIMLAKRRNSEKKQLLSRYYREVFHGSRDWAADIKSDIRIASDYVGCFMLQDDIIRAISDTAECVVLANSINKIKKVKLDQIAAGRSTVFGFTHSGIIYYAVSGQHTVSGSFDIHSFVEEQNSSLLNIAESGSGSLLAAVQMKDTIQVFHLSLPFNGGSVNVELLRSL